MKRLLARGPLVALAFFAAAATLCSCNDEGPGDVPPDPDCIGPAGGTISVNDPDDSLHGVGLSVAPGDWQECWSVYFGYKSTFSTPNFPTGLMGYEGMLTGALDLQIGRQLTWEEWLDAPDSLQMELTFPLRDLAAAPNEMLTAFRFDEQAGIYRLEFPTQLDAERMTVSTSRHRPLWTWGKIDLDEGDFDTYLAPVMEQMHGQGVWLEIQAKLDSLQLAAIAEQREATCASLEIVHTALAAARVTAGDNVRAIQDLQAGHCGVCDATTPVFYEELSEYLQLRVEAFLFDLFLGGARNPLIKIYGLIMTQYKLYCARQLGCDYECFVESVDSRFYIQLATYYACSLTIDLIEWALMSDYMECG
jgi:hypothetical protein